MNNTIARIVQTKLTARRKDGWTDECTQLVEKFQDKVNWDYISIYQELSESFLEKFQDKST